MEPFSSISDRPRDALLTSLHQRELQQKDQKISRLKHANDESLKRAYEAQHRGNQLAQVLGFLDVFEAQMAIDVAGEEVSYRECFERVLRLEEEVGETKKVNEGLKERVDLLEHEAELGGEKRGHSEELEKFRDENKALLERIAALEAGQTCRNDEDKTTTPSSATTFSRLEQELKQLQDLYDKLLGVKERAAARYKLDYAMWKKVKDWIYNEEESELDKENVDEGLSEEEKRRRYKKNIMLKKRILRENEEGGVITPSPFSKPPPLGRVEFKEDETPPRLQSTQSSLSHSESTAHHIPIPSLRNKLLDAVAHPKRPSSSPNLFNEGSLSRPLPPAKPQTPSISISRNEDSDPPSSPSPKDGNNVEPRSSPTVVGTVLKPIRNRLLESAARTKESMSSPTVFNSAVLSPSSSARKPLVFEPVTLVRPRSTSIHVKEDIVSLPTPLDIQHDVAASSETEEESQVAEDEPVIHLPKPRLELLIPTSPTPVLSSETEPESQSQIFSLPLITVDPTPCPPRPAKLSLAQPQAQARSQASSIAPAAKPPFPRDRRVVSNRDGESLRARKMRRVEDDDEKEEREEENEGVKIPEFRFGEKKGKERERDMDVDVDVEGPSSTPANPPPSTAQKRIEDYSVYKGRGRYGKQPTAPKDTINARFEIDPARNGGLDYQYEEVVRGKNDRRRMEAGDCECCCDYYEAVGPLPKRLQAPLWRSPPATPAAKSHHCLRHGSGSNSKSTTTKSHSHSSSSSSRRQQHEKENEITSHRQAISRHRHHWDRPKTPPKYWNIGFPDTQETEEINEMAREMHRRKRDEVEREAERGRGKGGRWRRRG